MVLADWMRSRSASRRSDAAAKPAIANSATNAMAIFFIAELQERTFPQSGLTGCVHLRAFDGKFVPEESNWLVTL
jgi:hypothetical protein